MCPEGSTTAITVEQVARVADGAQEIDSLALYNGQRTLLLSVQKAQDENTIGVVDGLNKAVADMQTQLPPGVRLALIADGSRPIRVAVDNVRSTLIEGDVGHDYLGPGAHKEENHYYQGPPGADPGKLRQAYLHYLLDKASPLSLGSIDPKTAGDAQARLA